MIVIGYLLIEKQTKRRKKHDYNIVIPEQYSLCVESHLYLLCPAGVSALPSDPVVPAPAWQPTADILPGKKLINY